MRIDIRRVDPGTPAPTATCGPSTTTRRPGIDTRGLPIAHRESRVLAAGRTRVLPGHHHRRPTADAPVGLPVVWTAAARETTGTMCRLGVDLAAHAAVAVDARSCTRSGEQADAQHTRRHNPAPPASVVCLTLPPCQVVMPILTDRRPAGGAGRAGLERAGRKHEVCDASLIAQGGGAGKKVRDLEDMIAREAHRHAGNPVNPVFLAGGI